MIAVAVLLTALPPYRLTAQVDPTGTWRTLTTDHFLVHVRAEHRELGLRAAGEAEAAYAAYQRILPAPRGRIHLVVADNVDFANGYASTWPANRIVVYAYPPAGDIQLDAYDRWLRLAITHELAHIFHLDLARGWWAAGRSVLGRAPFLFPNQYAPPWLTEGLAVFYEARLTGAGRLEGGYHRAIVRAEAAEGGGIPLDEASTPTPKWPAGLRAYAFGATFTGWAAAGEGDSAVARLARITSGRPMPYLQLSSSWRRLTSASLGRLWRDWQRAEARGEASLPAAAERVLLSGLRTAVAPRVSPDGALLLVARQNGREVPRLVTLDRRTGRQRELAELRGTSSLAWRSPAEAVVADLEYTDLYTLRGDLWTVSADGRRRRLTNAARLRDPDVAPDGRIVAVRAVPGGTELVELSAARCLLPAVSCQLPADSTIRVLARSGPGIEWAGPRFNASGSLIAAVRVVNGRHDIVLLSRQGAIVRQVTSDSVPDLQPAFTPDGRWLVWSRELGGIPQIVGLRVGEDGSGSEAAQFSHAPYAAWAPGPANDSLYYLSYHADGFRLVAAPLAGSPWSLPVLDTVPAPAPPPQTAIRSEGGYRGLALMQPRYWMPQAFLATRTAWFGAITSGADPLERHAYFASLLLGTGAAAGQWRGSLSYAWAGPGHALLDASASHDPQLIANVDSSGRLVSVDCCDPDDALDLGLTIIRRRWRSQASLRLGAEYTRDFGAERIGGSLSGVLASTVTPALAISPEQGARLSGLIRYRRRTQTDQYSVEYVMRATAYRGASFPGFAHHVQAARLAVGVVSGTDPVVFSVGGVSSTSVTLIPGLPIGGSPRTFGVRSFPPRYLSGSRALAISLEERVPLALVARGLGLLPAGLDRLSASGFVDVGRAWSPAYCPGAPPQVSNCAATIAAPGAELVADLGIAYQLPLRLRIGGAIRFQQLAGSGVDYLGAGSYFALGTAF